MFLTDRWRNAFIYPWPQAEGPGQSPAFSQSLGAAVLQWFYVQTDTWWIWVGGWLFVWGFIVIFLTVLAIAIMYLKRTHCFPFLWFNVTM